MRQIFFWVATALGGLTLVLVIVNGVLFLGNQSRQAEVSARQRFIEQSVEMSRINDQLIHALAKQAIVNHDNRLLDLLGQNGINVSTNPAAAPAPAAAPPAPASSVFLPSAKR